MENKEFNNESLLKFLFRESSREEDDQIRDWVNEDKANGRMLDKWLRTLADKESKSNSDWAKDDLHIIRQRISRRRLIKSISRIAAIFVSVMLLSSVLLTLLNNEKIELNTVVVKKGTAKELVLSDGTKVWLASDTKFSYPESFTSKERRVFISGQAYFDVAHNKECPFIVETNYTDVKVLGTKFNIKAYSYEPQISTVLVEGSVKLDFKNSANNIIKDQILSPNQKCVFNHNTLKHIVTKVDLNHELAWREKRLSFKNETFKQIANKIERHYNVEVILPGNELSQKRLTGEFDGETIEEVLETFQEWTDFKFNIENEIVKITN